MAVVNGGGHIQLAQGHVDNPLLHPVSAADKLPSIGVGNLGPNPSGVITRVSAVYGHGD